MHGSWRGSYLHVQVLGLQDVIVDDADLDALVGLRQVLDQLAQLGATDAVGAVHGDEARALLALQRGLECLAQLLVVALFADVPVRVLCALCVLAPHQVVQLRGGQDLVVGVLSVGGLQGVDERGDERRARGAGVASKDDAGRVLAVHL